MPKLKTHSGAKKRVRVTKTGKLIRRRAYRNHFLSKKRSSRKRLYGKSHQFSSSDKGNIKQQLGVG